MSNKADPEWAYCGKWLRDLQTSFGGTYGGCQAMFHDDSKAGWTILQAANIAELKTKCQLAARAAERAALKHGAPLRDIMDKIKNSSIPNLEDWLARVNDALAIAHAPSLVSDLHAVRGAIRNELDARIRLPTSANPNALWSQEEVSRFFAQFSNQPAQKTEFELRQAQIEQDRINREAARKLQEYFAAQQSMFVPESSNALAEIQRAQREQLEYEQASRKPKTPAPPKNSKPASALVPKHTFKRELG